MIEAFLGRKMAVRQLQKEDYNEFQNLILIK